MPTISDALAKAKIIIISALKEERPSMSLEQKAARWVIMEIEIKLETLRRADNAENSTIKQS